MRCKACNNPLNNSPMYVKIQGKQYLNDYCSRCTLISTNPDMLDYAMENMQEDAELIDGIVKGRVRPVRE